MDFRSDRLSLDEEATRAKKEVDRVEVGAESASGMGSFLAGSQLPDLDLSGRGRKEQVDVVDETVMDVQVFGDRLVSMKIGGLGRLEYV